MLFSSFYIISYYIKYSGADSAPGSRHPVCSSFKNSVKPPLCFDPTKRRLIYYQTTNDSWLKAELHTLTYKRLSIELSSSFKVMVWKADLITFVADTIVNAANENLQHYGGLALPLCKAGGQDIVEESDLHIQKHGRLKTGEAIVTNAGNLPCKKIIHAVGPRVKKNPSHGALCRARKTLTKTVKNILQRVKELNLQSVAIAAISSGISNFPLPLCADIIVSTVKDFYEQKVHPHQLVVHLVNNDEPSYLMSFYCFHRPT
uniref:Macro domain-containing protein n=1 Tax=Labrus bergylta TaxID=56723 RepID=A0A3Q3M7Z5_9LABR